MTIDDLKATLAPSEPSRRDEVMARILADIQVNRRIKLPDFDRERERPDDRYALLSVGIEPNGYSGTAGDFRYQFEGEEDLLHLIVTRRNGEEISVNEGQTVASFVLAGLPPALIWLRPGTHSQHFYFGHDDLLSHMIV